MINLKVAKERQQGLNKDLTVANNKLEEINNNFKKANLELLDSNNIKEVYISRFFKLCSTYVDRMHNFRKQVNKKLLKKEYSDLMKMTSCASDLLVTEQQELYEHFDSAFLHIFPNFVASVNNLLLPGEQFILKEGELLNTELRICALIRLGFVKSAQIAELLHYSPTTIYNYRTRLREKALSRDVFERKSDANPITIALQNNYKSIIEIFCQKKSLLSATIFSTFLVYVMLYNFLKIRYLYAYKCFKIYFFQFHRFNVYSL